MHLSICILAYKEMYLDIGILKYILSISAQACLSCARETGARSKTSKMFLTHGMASIVLLPNQQTCCSPVSLC